MKPLVHRKRKRDRNPPVVRHKTRITKGDRVRVISGEFKGQEGTVMRVLPKVNRVVVEGINIVKRHKKATQEAEGGIIQFAAPVHASNVMLLDPKSGDPTRVRRKKDKDGTVERISVKSGQAIPRSR
jgi:large subunit ribosomal protein L24